MTAGKIGLIFGVCFCLTGVVLGAFGAHLLREFLTAEQLTSFETGVRYQMFHGLTLIVISVLNQVFSLKFIKGIVWLFVFGSIFFSCSIYLLNLSTIWDINLRWLGPITPMGGTLIIIGWVLLLLDSFRFAKARNA